MKGLATLSFLGFLYLLIIIIFNEASGEPRGVQNEGNIGQPSTSGASQEKNEQNGTKNTTSVPTLEQVIFGHVASEQLPSQKGKPTNNASSHTTSTRQANTGFNLNQQQNQKKNDSNPLADLFQITDPNMRSTMSALYGAYKGNDQCSRKAFCQLGNYMKDMPGRDLIFLMMGNYIPTEYSLYYEIFKAAVVYGQNCQVYVCIPEPQEKDAAAAARPAQGFSNSPNPNTIPR